jgi:hypothetical protein
MRNATKPKNRSVVVVADWLRSFRAAMKVIGMVERQETGRRLNRRLARASFPFVFS